MADPAEDLNGPFRTWPSDLWRLSQQKAEAARLEREARERAIFEDEIPDAGLNEADVIDQAPDKGLDAPLPVREGRLGAKDRLTTKLASNPRLLDPQLKGRSERKAAQELFEMRFWDKMLKPERTARAIDARRAVIAGDEAIKGRGERQLLAYDEALAGNQAALDRMNALTAKEVDLNRAGRELSEEEAKELRNLRTQVDNAKKAQADRVLAESRTDPKTEAFMDFDSRLKAAYADTDAKWGRRIRAGKMAVGGTAVTAGIGYAAYKAGQMIADANANSDYGQRHREILERVASGLEVSPEDREFLVQSFSMTPGIDGEAAVSALEADRPAVTVEEDGAAAGGVPPYLPGMGPDPMAMGFIPDSLVGDGLSAVGGALEAGRDYLNEASAPYMEVPEYRPVPDPEIEMLFDPELYAEAKKNPNVDQAELEDWAQRAQSIDIANAAGASAGAGLENTAAALGLPAFVQDYARGSEEYQRAVDQGEPPVSDNWWNRNVALPMQEGNERMADFYSKPENRTDPVLEMWDSLPEGVREDLSAINRIVNPGMWLYGLAGTTSDDIAAMPYNALRSAGALAQTPYALPGDELPRSFADRSGAGAVWNEMVRGAGGEPVGGEPRITEGALPLERPPVDMSGLSETSFGPGPGVLNTGMMGMEDLAALERIGALGKNPDGSNMTVAQYIQQGNLAGAGMEAAMPAFGGQPVPPEMGPVIPIDPRLEPRQPVAMPPLPPAPSDRPITMRLPSEVPGPMGTSGAFLDENAGDYRRADMEWNRLATLLGLTPTGEPVRGRIPPDTGASPRPGLSFGPNAGRDQGGGFDLGSLLGVSPAYAGTDDDQATKNEVADEIISRDETMYPVGQTDAISGAGKDGGLSMGEEVTGPVPSWTNWLTYGLVGDPDVTDADAPAGEFPADDPRAYPDQWPSRYPVNVGTAAVAAQPNGPRGDFNGSRGSVDAGLAENAAAAEEELNWINRMMRDKLGMTDASERARAAQALISFGSGVLASGGDSWQAIGEGIQAASGDVNRMLDEEAAAMAAQQEAILDENRWRAEMALKELEAQRGGDLPDKIETLRILTADLEAQGFPYAEAYKRAMDMVFQPDLFTMIQ